MPSLQDALVIEPATADQLSFRLSLTNSFVAARGSLFGLLILFALIGYFVWPQLKVSGVDHRGHHRRKHDRVDWVTVLGLDFALGRGRGVGMRLLVPLMWFSGTIESRWGEKRLPMFAAIVIVVVNGFACLSPMFSLGVLSARSPEQRIGLRHRSDGERPLDGVVSDVCARQTGDGLNIEARKLVWVLVILGFLDILFVGRLKGLMTLMAILTAYLLVSGLWRPTLLIGQTALDDYRGSEFDGGVARFGSSTTTRGIIK